MRRLNKEEECVHTFLCMWYAVARSLGDSRTGTVNGHWMGTGRALIGHRSGIVGSRAKHCPAESGDLFMQSSMRDVFSLHRLCMRGLEKLCQTTKVTFWNVAMAIFGPWACDAEVEERSWLEDEGLRQPLRRLRLA